MANEEPEEDILKRRSAACQSADGLSGIIFRWKVYPSISGGACVGAEFERVLVGFEGGGRQFGLQTGIRAERNPEGNAFNLCHSCERTGLTSLDPTRNATPAA